MIAVAPCTPPRAARVGLSFPTGPSSGLPGVRTQQLCKVRRLDRPEKSDGTSTAQMICGSDIPRKPLQSTPSPFYVTRLPSHHSSCLPALASLRRTHISRAYITLNCTRPTGALSRTLRSRCFRAVALTIALLWCVRCRQAFDILNCGRGDRLRGLWSRQSARRCGNPVDRIRPMISPSQSALA